MATDTEVKIENGVKPEPAVKAEPGNEGAVPAADGAAKKKRRNYKKKKATEGGEVKPEAEGSAEPKQPVAAVEHDNTAKVFVGNLSFETTKQEVEEIFGKAGKVTDVNIITRGERSLGYGFISFETDDDADKAVSALDKSEIAGRQINVERAQDKDAKAARGRPGRGRGGARRGGRGYSRGGARVGRDETAARVDGDDANEAAEDAEGEATGEDGARRGRGGARRGRRFSKTPRPARGDGETSSTTLFVANLPFRFKDADLLAVFKDYNAVSAHVVTMRSGRSKGFGFVELANKEEQEKALRNIGTPAYDDRELVIKVAMAHQTGPAEVNGHDEQAQ